MGTTNYGNLGTTLVEYPNQPTRTRENGKWSYNYRYWCAKASADDLIPEDGAERTINGTTYYLSRAQVDENEVPNMADVTLSYSESGAGVEVIYKSGDVTRRVEVQSREIPRTDQRVYDAIVAGDIADPGEGVESVPVAVLHYEHTTYLGTFTWSEANLIAATGTGTTAIDKVGAPTSIAGATAAKWMFRGTSIDDDGTGQIRRVETWDFCNIPWEG